jgi:hypothetical protein
MSFIKLKVIVFLLVFVLMVIGDHTMTNGLFLSFIKWTINPGTDNCYPKPLEYLTVQKNPYTAAFLNFNETNGQCLITRNGILGEKNALCHGALSGYIYLCSTPEKFPCTIDTSNNHMTIAYPHYGNYVQNDDNLSDSACDNSYYVKYSRHGNFAFKAGCQTTCSY